MCGISLLLQFHGKQLQSTDVLLAAQTTAVHSQPLGDCKTFLSRRGPDSYQTHKIKLADAHLSLTASVLHLRGARINQQPLVDQHTGDVLLWNGEVFDGLSSLTDSDNDGARVLQMMTNRSKNENENDKCSIFNALHCIEGPFAFIFYQRNTNKLWFGRDVLGRRSLLFAFDSDKRLFAVSSTGYQSQHIPNDHWHELSNSGVYALDIHSGKFSHHSWRLIRSSQNEQKQETHLNEQDDNEETCSLPLVMYSSKLDIQSLFTSSLNSVSYTEIVDAFLNVFCSAIQKRVRVPNSSKLLRHRYLMQRSQEWTESVYWQQQQTSDNLHQQWMRQQNEVSKLEEANIGILYSGGIDSQILAALCDRFVPQHEAIDLINVVCGDDCMASPDRLTAINGLIELQTCVNPKRKWRLIKVDIRYEEIVAAKSRILALNFPCSTVMDFNIGNILWFGARAIGTVKDEYQWIENHELVRYAHVEQQLQAAYARKVQEMNVDELVRKQVKLEFAPQKTSVQNQLPKREEKKQKRLGQKLKRKRCKEIKSAILNEIKEEIYSSSQRDHSNDEQNEDLEEKKEIEQETLYISAARVLLLGFGSDELLAGYGRHRTSFKLHGVNGLEKELNKDFDRLWKRNLGRDDRLISDHSREARWPFLDEQFIAFIKQLPLHYVCDLTQPLGIGDKKLLRDCAQRIGLKHSWSLVKRAIQFGSRIANNKVAGYAAITEQLTVDDLINVQIYNKSDALTNESVTKKYNKQNGKNGYE